MSGKVACVCGHSKRGHVEPPFTDEDRLWFRCFGGEDGPNWKPCPCEGYELPIKPGQRLVFGEARQPRKAAESAPAWPPLGETK